MKIGILHHDLEPTEERIKYFFLERNVEAFLKDVRKSSIYDFKDSDIVLNRVYASVANRDYSSIKKTLNLLSELELKNIYCLNSAKTSLYDYNKFESYKIMRYNKVLTPKTILINSAFSLKRVIEESSDELGYPLILKRNSGGRGKDISKINSKLEFKDALLKKFSLAKSENYFGGFIAQEFIKSLRIHDCRIGIVNGKFAFSYKRSLVSLNGETPWLASTSNGSVERKYQASDLEIKEALNATNSIGAKFNELDVLFSDKGHYIIENNPTPNYFVSDLEDQKRMKKFVDIVLNEFGSKNE